MGSSSSISEESIAVEDPVKFPVCEVEGRPHGHGSYLFMFRVRMNLWHHRGRKSGLLVNLADIFPFAI